MTDTIKACPECDDPRVQRNTSRGLHGDTKKYRCRACKAKFNTPVERPRKDNRGHNVSGLAAMLDEMDPDDLPA